MQLEEGSVHAMIVQTITNLDLNDSCEMPTTFFYKGKMAKLLKSDTRDSVTTAGICGWDEAALYDAMSNCR